MDDKAGPNLKETKFTLRSDSGEAMRVPLDAAFSYSIVADRNDLTVSATYDGVTYSAVDHISRFWPGKELYFKAGLYLGVGRPGSGAGTTGYGGGTSSFYALDLSHP